MFFKKKKLYAPLFITSARNYPAMKNSAAEEMIPLSRLLKLQIEAESGEKKTTKTIS